MNKQSVFQWSRNQEANIIKSIILTITTLVGLKLIVCLKLVCVCHKKPNVEYK